MMAKRFAWVAAVMVAVVGDGAMSSEPKESGAQTGAQISIPVETVADYLHAVIESDRTFYTIHVVERLQAKGVLVASENWLSANKLPLPAQFLLESSRLAAMTRTRISYRLISSWPINKQNGPRTEFERTGLGDVLVSPDRPYTGIVTNGQDRYFQAIYADKAVSQACIGCHNAHQDSPRRDFKINDVMGGIIISIPLEQEPRN